MIQQANFKESEDGNVKNAGILSEMTGVSVIGRPVNRLGWKALLVFLMLSPMASFEQDGRIGEHQRQTVAVLRQKTRTAQMPETDCCDPSESDMGRKDPRVGPLSFPDARSLERADREMIRNHAENRIHFILPSLAMPQIEDADKDMDLMFRMSTADWTTLLETADFEMDVRFRIENILLETKLDFRGSDEEMNDRFQQEQQQA
jgi:hypothetical protein